MRETERDVHNKMIINDGEVEKATVVLDQIKQESLKHLEGTDKCNTFSIKVETRWLRTPLTTLSQNDKDEIVGHKELGDKIIESAQNILRNQLPDFNGFQSTIFKQNLKQFYKVDKNMIQILHRGDIKSGHWFTISTVDCKEGTINWYDSIYNDLDEESKQQICAIMKPAGKNLIFQKCPVQLSRFLIGFQNDVPCLKGSWYCRGANVAMATYFMFFIEFSKKHLWL